MAIIGIIDKKSSFRSGKRYLPCSAPYHAGMLACAREEDATQAVLGLAAGTIDEPGFVAWLRTTAKPARKTR